LFGVYGLELMEVPGSDGSRREVHGSDGHSSKRRVVTGSDG